MMLINNIYSIEEYIRTVHREEIKRVERLHAGIGDGQAGFRVDNGKLEYFAQFLKNHQYSNNNDGNVPLLNIFRDSYHHLYNWENKIEEATESEKKNYRNLKDRFEQFRSLLNHIISVFLKFSDNNLFPGQYYNQKNNFSSESYDLLSKFSKDYGNLWKELIMFEISNGEISYLLISRLLKDFRNSRSFQNLNYNTWYDLYEYLENLEIELKPTKILGKINTSKVQAQVGLVKENQILQLSKEENQGEILKNYLIRLIDRDSLVKNPDLREELRNDEYAKLFGIIKELLSELRDGDEINLDDANKIINENIQLEFINSEEIAGYFKNLLIKIPDFEYIRLKNSFRLKGSSVNELLSNLDFYFQGHNFSLKSIEEGIKKLKSGQEELLGQTKEIQDFLEQNFKEVIQNQDKIEKYLFVKLGSDYEKIKEFWYKYKKKELSGKEFTKNASRVLGEKFVNIFGDLLFFLK
ncbi:MAG: hypothetical protein HeimC3_49990 [Candidatus Heimdallarchaeota archaeon LC_3]|nr:MAG: hypothetical protein HeimC3_49990 [Candidatus Heimdallarchaeota archaeon LC_3]